MRKIKVSYMSGHKNADKEGVIDKLKFKSIMLDRDFGKLYQSGLFKLLALEGCPVKLFMFLCEICSDSNHVLSGTALNTDFILWMEKATGKKDYYTTETLNKSFAALKKINLVVMLTRGSYKLNPVHFWKGPKESDRVDSVRNMLEKGLIKPFSY
jgi:hypothetical protein